MLYGKRRELIFANNSKFNPYVTINGEQSSHGLFEWMNLDIVMVCNVSENVNFLPGDLR